jgi:hypothetical protein
MPFTPPRTPPGHLSRLAADSLETARTPRTGAPVHGPLLRSRSTAFGMLRTLGSVARPVTTDDQRTAAGAAPGGSTHAPRAAERAVSTRRSPRSSAGQGVGLAMIKELLDHAPPPRSAAWRAPGPLAPKATNRHPAPPSYADVAAGRRIQFALPVSRNRALPPERHAYAEFPQTVHSGCRRRGTRLFLRGRWQSTANEVKCADRGRPRATAAPGNG